MSRSLALNPDPDPVASQDGKNGWKILLGLAIGLPSVLVGALSGVCFDKGAVKRVVSVIAC
jgi:hypothetical protein